MSKFKDTLGEIRAQLSALTTGGLSPVKGSDKALAQIDDIEYADRTTIENEVRNEFEAKIKAQEEQIAQLTKRLEQAAIIIGDKNSAIDDLNSSVEALLESTDTLNQENEAQKAAAQKATEALESQKQSHISLSGINLELTEKLTLATSQISILTESLNASKGQNTTYTSRIDTLEQQLFGKDSELAQLRTAHRIELETVRNQASALQDEANQAKETARLALIDKEKEVERSNALQRQNREKDITIAELENDLNVTIPELKEGILGLKTRLQDGEWYKQVAQRALLKAGMSVTKVTQILNKEVDVTGIPAAPRTKEEIEARRGFNPEVASRASSVLEQFDQIQNAAPQSRPKPTVSTTETPAEKIARIRRETEARKKTASENNTTWQGKEDGRRASTPERSGKGF